MGRKLWEMGIEGLDGVSGGKGKPTPIGPSGSRSFVMEGVTYADTPKNHPKILSDVAWVKVAESCLQGRPSAAAWWKDLSVIAYYNTLKVLRQELDLYQHIEMEYALDATRLAKMIEQDQIFNLLAGLNPQLDREEVKYLENILFHPYMKFIPMCSEESRRVVMTGPTPQENSALNTIQDSNLGLPKGGENESRWSDHCNKPRHTRETCWKLHGKPPSRAKDSHKCNKQFRTSKGF
uniref:Uncharacterized protein n=1 Tax=Vitis vinifera TaxID=29760 RepID=A5C770_VITVI|nr:hypothetical protein VITISV_036135 [Vitis vinifera]